MNKTLLIIAAFCMSLFINAQDILPRRGLAIAAPNKETVDRFVKFIKEELPPRQINTLILRVDYNFQYQSHPKLRKEKYELIKVIRENFDLDILFSNNVKNSVNEPNFFVMATAKVSLGCWAPFGPMHFQYKV